MNTQFGLMNVWAQGDWVARAVLLILLAMSLASWIVMLVKVLDLRRLFAQSASTEKFWHAQNFEQGLQILGAHDENPFYALAAAGHSAEAHLKQEPAQVELLASLDRSEWITRILRNGVDDATAKMQSGLTILASTGSTAPFVGLFGTVWGIYHALMSIGLAGQATIDKVAGPVGESLIMTALGLAVAIPAVLGYNALVRGNKQILSKLNRFAHDLHAYFLTGARVKSSAVTLGN